MPREVLTAEQVRAVLKAGGRGAKRQNEAAFTKQVIDYARLRGWKVAHFRAVRVQRKNGSCYFETPVQGDGAGFPDLFMVRWLRCIAVELKIGKNPTTAEQRDWLTRMNSTGIETFVWYPSDWGHIERFLA
jgi:hypothetical protein